MEPTLKPVVHDLGFQTCPERSRGDGSGDDEADWEAARIRTGATVASQARAGCQSAAADPWIGPADPNAVSAITLNVFHTPQARGMPTKAQNSAALASNPPLPRSALMRLSSSVLS